MTHETAKKQNLEPVFPEKHGLGTVIFWDSREGKYYDASTDLYLDDYDPLEQR